MGTLKIGELAPDFKLKGVDGKSYSLKDFQGKQAIAVIFSCNHCPYVKAWEGRIIAIQRDYAAKGVQLVAINANDAKKYPEDSFENMIRRAREKNFNFPYLHDETQEIAKAYGAQRTPEVFLLDKDFKLRYHGTIDDNWEYPERVTKEYFRDALDAMLAGKEAPVKETTPVGCTIKWK